MLDGKIKNVLTLLTACPSKQHAKNSGLKAFLKDILDVSPVFCSVGF